MVKKADGSVESGGVDYSLFVFLIDNFNLKSNRSFGFYFKRVVFSPFLPPLIVIIKNADSINGGVFMLINGRSIKNPLIIGFLSIDSNQQLYNEYLLSNSIELEEKINKRFYIYCYKARLVSYFSKTIYFEAINYDKKIRKFSENTLLILDKPISDGNSCLIEQIKDDSINNYSLESNNIEDYINDSRLLNAVKILTERQKQILYLAYIKDLKDTEISKLLLVSQQSISKTKKTALRRIRGELDAR